MRLVTEAIILKHMQIELLYFGMLKDQMGREQESLDLEEGACVNDVLRLLRSRASNSGEMLWASLAVAVNREYAGRSTVLHDADEVALLPPVSGGLVRDVPA